VGRAAFVSTNLIEALAIYKTLSATTFDAMGEDECQPEDFELLVKMVLGLQDPFDLDTRTLDHDLLELFWDTVEGMREELLYRRLVRGTLHSIKLINLSGLVLVEFQEFPYSWLHKTNWFKSLL
jgi:hypothetical protein